MGMKPALKNAKKRALFFVPEDVLFPGEVNRSISAENVSPVLQFLKGLESRGIVELFLISGRSKEKAGAEIAAAGLEKYFRKSNIFLLSNGYLESKEPFDRERYVSNIGKDPLYVDEFFKQHVIMGLIASGKVRREECVLVGHDLWFDGFYTSRFSGIDFALVGESFSERNVPSVEIPKWVHCMGFSVEDFTSLILGKQPKQDTKFLEAYIFRKLGRELVDPKELAGMVRKAQEKKAVEGLPSEDFTYANK